MNLVARAAVFAVLLFGGLLIFLELGRRWGEKQLARDPEHARDGTGAVEGAVFALLGLLIAFTFSGAAQRFDTRRHFVVDETNAIGTAWLRIDGLPEASQPPLRELFRQYLDSRIATYEKMPDVVAVKAELARSVALQNQIWIQAVAAVKSSPNPAVANLLLPALNEMIDIVTTRWAAIQYMHPPLAIYVMLFSSALLGALFAGAAMAGSQERSALHVIGFATILAASAYLIVDLEFPRLGLIRVDEIDQMMRDLRTSFG